MNHTLEIILFIILFCLVIYLFLLITSFYTLVQQDISNSELKMYDKINEKIKTELVKIQIQKKE